MRDLVAAVCAVALTVVAVPAAAQDFVASSARGAVVLDDAPRVALQGQGSTRRGFTILVNGGFGFQKDDFYEESSTGLAGVNLGIGGFVNPNLAILGRVSGTSVTYFDVVDQVSGVAGATVQFWTSERVAIEVGGGIGFWSESDASDNETGAGLIVGLSTAVLKGGGHNMVIGAEYAPAFTESGTVHNIGITIGYQFHKTR